MGEDVAVEVMRAGADDFFVKGKLGRLGSAVARELRDAENRRARLAAELQMRQLSKAVREAPVSLVITDTEGRIEYVNPRFTDVTGYSEEEVIGKNSRLLQSGHTPPETYRHLWATITAGGTWRGELLNRKKSGELYWENVSITSIADDAGKITHFLAVKLDVTVNKQAEAALRDAMREAEQIAEMKSQFLATMSHELRTPLNGIEGATYLLLDTKLDDEQRELVRTARESLQSLVGMVESILEFSRLEEGDAPIARQTFSMPELLESALQPLASKAVGKGLSFDYALSETAPDCVVGDPSKIVRVLGILLDNAIKFTEKGGIRVNTVCRDLPDGKVGFRFIVSDTGVGMTAEVCGRLFQPFMQADSSNRRRYGGAGIGLSIAQRLVLLMGGEIDMESEPGKGSAFWFDLALERC